MAARTATATAPATAPPPPPPAAAAVATDPRGSPCLRHGIRTGTARKISSRYCLWDDRHKVWFRFDGASRVFWKVADGRSPHEGEWVRLPYEGERPKMDSSSRKGFDSPQNDSKRLGRTASGDVGAGKSGGAREEGRGGGGRASMTGGVGGGGESTPWGFAGDLKTDTEEELKALHAGPDPNAPSLQVSKSFPRMWGKAAANATGAAGRHILPPLPVAPPIGPSGSSSPPSPPSPSSRGGRSGKGRAAAGRGGAGGMGMASAAAGGPFSAHSSPAKQPLLPLEQGPSSTMSPDRRAQSSSPLPLPPARQVAALGSGSMGGRADASAAGFGPGLVAGAAAAAAAAAAVPAPGPHANEPSTSNSPVRALFPVHSSPSRDLEAVSVKRPLPQEAPPLIHVGLGAGGMGGAAAGVGVGAAAGVGGGGVGVVGLSVPSWLGDPYLLLERPLLYSVADPRSTAPDDSPPASFLSHACCSICSSS
ncbi:hypothetical protein CLOP_g14726 [Closterium sp. NIES-67]|nr:hypothetical protein CLOP_g14726 [Closterium sp. NIES-67]